MGDDTGNIEPHVAYVRRVLHRMGLREDALDDASQDVLMTAYRRWPTFQGRSSVETWLYSICRNVACNERRRATRHDALYGEPLPELVDDHTPDAQMLYSQRRQALFNALQVLSEPKREALAFYEIGQLSASDVAILMRCRPRTVRARLEVARNDLASRVRRTNARLRTPSSEAPRTPASAQPGEAQTPAVDPRVELNIEFADGGLCIATLGHILLARWRGDVTFPRTCVLREHLTRMGERFPGRLVQIDTVEATSGFPDQQARSEIRHIISSVGPQAAAYAVVVDDTLIRRIQFGFFRGVMLLANASFPAASFKTLRDAIRWLSNMRVLDPVLAERIPTAFETLAEELV